MKTRNLKWMNHKESIRNIQIYMTLMMIFGRLTVDPLLILEDECKDIDDIDHEEKESTSSRIITEQLNEQNTDCDATNYKDKYRKLTFAALTRYEFITDLQVLWISFVKLWISALDMHLEFSDHIRNLSAVFDMNLHLEQIDYILSQVCIRKIAR